MEDMLNSELNFSLFDYLTLEIGISFIFNFTFNVMNRLKDRKWGIKRGNDH